MRNYVRRQNFYAVARNSPLCFGAIALGRRRTYGYASLRPNARLCLALRMSAAVRRNRALEVLKMFVGAYDNKQFYALNTLVVINLKENIVVDIKYLLALFNSKLLNWYYQSFLKSTKKVFSEIQARQIAQLPIRNLGISNSDEKRRHERIVSLVNDMIQTEAELQTLTPKTDKHNSLKREIEKLDREIDEAIYKLYGLTDEEIKTIEQ
jgi:adenine-specific DNA-methyltransferase